MMPQTMSSSRPSGVVRVPHACPLKAHPHCASIPCRAVYQCGRRGRKGSGWRPQQGAVSSLRARGVGYVMPQERSGGACARWRGRGRGRARGQPPHTALKETHSKHQPFACACRKSCGHTRQRCRSRPGAAMARGATPRTPHACAPLRTPGPAPRQDEAGAAGAGPLAGSLRRASFGGGAAGAAAMPNAAAGGASVQFSSRDLEFVAKFSQEVRFRFDPLFIYLYHAPSIFPPAYSKITLVPRVWKWLLPTSVISRLRSPLLDSA